jgi:hypothetical protein
LANGSLTSSNPPDRIPHLLAGFFIDSVRPTA